MRDELEAARYWETLRCKSKVAAYVAPPLEYDYALYLQYDRTGAIIEAKLARRETYEAMEKTRYRIAQRELDQLRNHLESGGRTANSWPEQIRKLAPIVEDLERRLGFETVTSELNTPQETAKN